jgi:hypothetical protein
METGLRPLSDALSEPLTKAYRVGGFGLAFLVLGAIFLATSAVSSRGALSYLVAAVGLLLVAVPCYFFYVKEIRPIASVQRQVKRNEELLNLIQEAAYKMTLTAYELQLLASRYADDVTAVLRVARPAMARIPLLARIAESSAFEQADWLGNNVVTLTGRSEQVIQDLKRALVDADPSALKKYLGELENLRGELKELLQAPATAPSPAASDTGRSPP